MEVAIFARVRASRVHLNDAKDPTLGTVIGLLAYDGHFGEWRRERATQIVAAGFAYARLAHAYYRTSGVPFPTPRAIDLNRVRGMAGDDTSPSAARQAKKSFDEANAILVKAGGSMAREKVWQVCVQEYAQARDWNASTIGLVGKALSALAEEGYQ